MIRSNMKKIILASGSPRRRELLEQIGLEFEVAVSDASEECNEKLPYIMVQKLSEIKAKAVYDRLRGDSARKDGFIVIGADTVVAYGDRILGKPKDRAQAREYLNLLQDNTHKVYTGVTLIRAAKMGGEPQIRSFYEETKVIFAQMTDEEIDEYIGTGDCMDKAGAYGIQGYCARYISGIEGDYNNVVGLPTARLYAEIKDWL
jgi:septum formation protein